MALKLLLLLFVGANALLHSHVQNPGKNAYVVMWISKDHVPEKVVQKFKVLTPEQEEAELTGLAEEGFEGLQSTLRMKLHEKKVEKLEESLEAGNALRGTSSASSDSENVGPKGWKHALKISKEMQAAGMKYPLVVMTNEPELTKINTNATMRQEYPNIVIKAVGANGDLDYLEQTCTTAALNKMHFQKLAVFGMEEYDKLIWLDLDSTVKKNLDVLFDSPEYDLKDGNQIWGQVDNWNCERAGPALHHFCSGMMLFKPNKKHLEGLLEQGKKMGWCWGDQKILARYWGKEGREKQLFPRSVVNWGHCGSKNSMVSHDQILR